MLIKSIKTQLKIIQQRKTYYLMFIAVFGWMLCNYFHNVFEFSGRDVLDTYQPMRILLLAGNGIYYHIFVMLFPIVVILPAAFSFLLDKDVNEHVFLQSKVGRTSYYLGKLIATFIATLMVFTIPFLIEIILNCIAFPMGATGLTSNLSLYDNVELMNIKRMLIPSLYINSIYAYAIVNTLIFGIVSGLLASFSLALSININFKFKAMLFLPTYILIYALSMIDDIIPNIGFKTDYYSYFDIFDTSNKSFITYLLFALTILGVSLGLILIKARKDSL